MLDSSAVEFRVRTRPRLTNTRSHLDHPFRNALEKNNHRKRRRPSEPITQMGFAGLLATSGRVCVQRFSKGL
jgi:hypothetical protein